MKTALQQEKSVFWLTQEENSAHNQQPLQGNHEADVIIIGGGMSGMSAAHSFSSHGYKVILLEQYKCGQGASGKSSGFITQNAELGLTHFVDVYGQDKARALWNFVTGGVRSIEDTIKTYTLNCDYIPEDSLIVATSKSGFKELTQEHNNYTRLGFESTLYTHEEIRRFIGSSSFYGGMRSGGTFGINGYTYLQELKQLLSKQGVTIYEHTPVITLEAHQVQTPHATLHARHIVVCTDRFTPSLGLLKHDIFHAQTFVVASNPLDTATIKQLFPQQRFLVWDTDMVYHYYRLTGDNRLIIGGSTLWQTFSYQQVYNSPAVYRKLTAYLKKKFPHLNLTFEYMWSGLIGISRDLQPIAGYDRSLPSIYYVGASTGLPWAAALGRYAAEAIVDKRNDFDEMFNPYRSYPLGNAWQHIIGKKATFALSNLISLRR